MGFFHDNPQGFFFFFFMFSVDARKSKKGRTLEQQG